MSSSGLLVVAWAYGLVFARAAGSSGEPLGTLGECARCFAENARLTGRIEQLLVRVGQLEVELATLRADGQGANSAREGGLNGAFVHDNLHEAASTALSCPVPC
jgi:hypothetical protein